MLQSLLVERFNLKTHYESKSKDVLLLLTNGKQLRMAEPKDRTLVPYMNVSQYQSGKGNGAIVAENASMFVVAQRLSTLLELVS